MRVHGQPTIFYEDEISVKADSPEEAAEMAKEAFMEINDKIYMLEQLMKNDTLSLDRIYDVLEKCEVLKINYNK